MRLTSAGWPRPVIGGLPIPWVSPPDDLSQTSGARKEACASGAICQVCGLGYDDGEPAFALVHHEGKVPAIETVRVNTMDNAVMHLRCIKLALAFCPKLKALRAEGKLQAIRTEGNLATPKWIKGDLTAVLDGHDCHHVDLEEFGLPAA